MNREVSVSEIIGMAAFCLFMLALFSLAINYIDDNASKNLDNIKMTWEESRILLEDTNVAGADRPVGTGSDSTGAVLEPVEQVGKEEHR